MNELQTVLSVVNSRGWVTGVIHEELALSLLDNFNMEQRVSEYLIKSCLNNQYIEIAGSGRRYKITKRGIDYLNRQALNSNITTKPISTQLKPSAKDRLWKGLKVNFMNLAMGVAGSILASLILAKCIQSANSKTAIPASRKITVNK